MSAGGSSFSSSAHRRVGAASAGSEGEVSSRDSASLMLATTLSLLVSRAFTSRSCRSTSAMGVS
eukprot:3447557-Prymnesium_polylepis.1